MMLGVRTWGNDPDGSTLMLVGAYESKGDISDRLLRALPPVLSLAHDPWNSPRVPLLCDEMARDEPGQAAVLDQLIDRLLIGVLRAWFTRPEAQTPQGYRSQADPIVGKALKIMHEDPARAWTVAKLAADLLCEPDATVGTVADKVGYSSPFALSAAFKRMRGLSPQEHRARTMSST